MDGKQFTNMVISVIAVAMLMLCACASPSAQAPAGTQAPAEGESGSPQVNPENNTTGVSTSPTITVTYDQPVDQGSLRQSTRDSAESLTSFKDDGTYGPNLNSGMVSDPLRAKFVEGSITLPTKPTVVVEEESKAWRIEGTDNQSYYSYYVVSQNGQMSIYLATEEYEENPTILLLPDSLANKLTAAKTNALGWAKASIQGTAELSTDGKTLTFRPGKDLPKDLSKDSTPRVNPRVQLMPRTNYRFIVKGLLDENGKSLPEVNVMWTTVGMSSGDPTNFPLVTSSSPPFGAYEVDLNQKCITIQFGVEFDQDKAKSADAVSLYVTKMDASTGKVITEVVPSTVDITGHGLEVCPTNGLVENAHYQLEVSNSIFCPDCTEDQKLVVSEFVTKEDIDPQCGGQLCVTSTTPRYGEKDIARDIDIEVHFEGPAVNCEMLQDPANFYVIALNVWPFVQSKVPHEMNGGQVKCDSTQKWAKLVIADDALLHGGAMYMLVVKPYEASRGTAGRPRITFFTTARPMIRIQLTKVGIEGDTHDWWIKGSDCDLYLVHSATDGGSVSSDRLPSDGDYDLDEWETAEIDNGIIFETSDPVGDQVALVVRGYEQDCGDCWKSILQGLGDGVKYFGSQMEKEGAETAEEAEIEAETSSQDNDEGVNTEAEAKKSLGRTVQGIGILIKWVGWGLSKAWGWVPPDDDDYVGQYVAVWDRRQRWGIGLPLYDVKMEGGLRLWLTVEEVPPAGKQ